MIEPNFGEGQLQQCVNTEFTLRALRSHRVSVSPVIPTLIEEDILGWDSGFFLPWLPYGPVPNHKGCNVFLQYKLASLIEGPRGTQYADWGEPYLRFQIPHKTKTGSHYVTDYHQYDALRDLAQAKCEVYYATNQVLTRDELFTLAESQSLLDNTPLLDVRDVPEPHFYATFTVSSPHFLLHSDAKSARRTTGAKLIARIPELKMHSLEEDNALVFRAVHERLVQVKGTERFLRVYRELEGSNEQPREFVAFRKFVLLGAALARFFDIRMIRVWTM